MAVNKAILLGNAGADPRITHLEGGTTLAQFTLATSETYTDRGTGEKKETTEWHNIVCWNSLADIAGNFVKKGARLYIEGKLRTRSWDGTDGVKHYITEIIAVNLQLLDRKDQGASSGRNTPLPSPDGQPETSDSRRPRQTLTEAAAQVAAHQGRSREDQQSDRQHTEPRVKPEEITREEPDDLPF